MTLGWTLISNAFNVASGLASIIGVIVSAVVARSLKAFRNEVLLRSALEDLEGKLSVAAKNLKAAKRQGRDPGADLSTLRAHVVEIQGKCPKGEPFNHSKRLLALLDATDYSLDGIINALAGLKASMEHFRRDRRWKI